MSLCLDMSMVSQPHTEQGVMKGVLTLLYHSQHFIGATWAFLWKTGWHLLPTCVTGPQFYLINIIGKVVECSQNSWTAVDFLYLFAKPLWQSKSLSFSPVVHVHNPSLPQTNFCFPLPSSLFSFLPFIFFFLFQFANYRLGILWKGSSPCWFFTVLCICPAATPCVNIQTSKAKGGKKKKKGKISESNTETRAKNVTEKYKHMLVWISGHIKQQSQ